MGLKDFVWAGAKHTALPSLRSDPLQDELSSRAAVSTHSEFSLKIFKDENKTESICLMSKILALWSQMPCISLPTPTGSRISAALCHPFCPSPLLSGFSAPRSSPPPTTSGPPHCSLGCLAPQHLSLRAVSVSKVIPNCWLGLSWLRLL